ncbi:MAG: acetate--CoA ligase family protein [Deltaproteobacteria bacterium]
MDIKSLLTKAKSEGRTALTEAEAKQVLNLYGVPVVKECVAKTPEEAAGLAESLGFPVVLKGLGTKLTHKTERGLVHLNLKDREEVIDAAQAIAQSAGPDLEGYLVSPLIKGRREFVAGMFCDPQFGPIVMFGLGGIFTEAMGDVVFRVAPLDEHEAASMLDELRAAKLLGPFRGDAAVFRDEIVKTLVALSRLALDWEAITEVDINPLIVGPDGHVTAVDALIILGERPVEVAARPPVDPREIGNMFSPKSVAFIGASAQLGKWGNMLMTTVMAGGYEGEIYLVNPKAETIAGRKVYKTIGDVPGPVDLAIVTVPAVQSLALIPELKARGIRYMLLISSGFGEVGPEGRELEKKLVRLAAENGVSVLGPNTMGICNPHIKFYCIGTPCWPKAGSIGLLSQSGNLGTQLMAFAEAEGIGIRSFCGSGNEAMITIEDYLRTAALDDVTKSIILYVESMKDGRRFFKTAQKVSRRKPVVLLKGGRTAAGSRAAASHTGAMASNIKILNAACRQAGVVLADQPMDLLDLSAAFSSLPLPRGKRVGIMTLGGGWGVVTTDLCIENGLMVPHLTPDVIAQINQILPPFWSKENPIDLVGEMGAEIPVKVLEILARWDECDAIIHLGVVGRLRLIDTMIKAARDSGQEVPQDLYEVGIKLYKDSEAEVFQRSAELMTKYGKPILGVFLDDVHSKTITEIPGNAYSGIAFLTPERAVKVLSRMVFYQDWLRREGI